MLRVCKAMEFLVSTSMSMVHGQRKASHPRDKKWDMSGLKPVLQDHAAIETIAPTMRSVLGSTGRMPGLRQKHHIPY